MKPLNNINITLERGQEIQLSNGKRAQITKIEFHEKTGEIRLNTTEGPRSALTFQLIPKENIARWRE